MEAIDACPEAFALYECVVHVHLPFTLLLALFFHQLLRKDQKKVY